MIVVIITGGSGTRLWPLSTHNYPKQLLKVNGDSRSLLQNTYDRAAKLSDQVYVMPETRLMDHVREQLPDVPEDKLIIEPALRGTASCLLAIMAEVAKSGDLDEPIAILWVDQFIRDVNGFLHSYNVAAEASRKHGRMVFIGIEPDHPATGFGYIQKDGVFDAEDYSFNVHSFKEKPDFETAQKFIQSGNYLWNSGSFVASVNTLTEQFRKYAPDWYDNYQKLVATKTPEEYQEIYLGFEKMPIEYALLEKAQDMLVVPATFDWLDLGSFSDLSKASSPDQEGNHVKGEAVATQEVTNSFIENHEDKPLVVIGLDNVVVVNTANGILVTRKDLSQKVGELSKQFQNKEK